MLEDDGGTTSLPSLFPGHVYFPVIFPQISLQLQYSYNGCHRRACCADGTATTLPRYYYGHGWRQLWLLLLLLHFPGHVFSYYISFLCTISVHYTREIPRDFPPFLPEISRHFFPEIFPGIYPAYSIMIDAVGGMKNVGTVYTVY